MQIINLTPHPLNISTPTGIVDISPSGTVARVAVNRKKTGEINGIPLYATTFGAVENLPEYEKGKLLVVSAIVRNHSSLGHRHDLASPGALIRDENGKVVGADGLDCDFDIGEK